jgi:hypothetical protein
VYTPEHFLLEPCKRDPASASCDMLCRKGNRLWWSYTVERRLGVLAEVNNTARVESGFYSLATVLTELAHSTEWPQSLYAC